MSPRPRLLALALFLAASSAFSRTSSCVEGAIGTVPGAVSALSTVASTGDVFAAVRLSPSSSPPVFVVEQTSVDGAAPRALYSAPRWITLLAADESDLVTVEQDGDRWDVVRIARASGGSAVVASWDRAIGTLGLTRDWIYVVLPAARQTPESLEPARIDRISRNTGRTEVVVAWTPAILPELAFDETHVYYAVQDDVQRTTVVRAAVDGFEAKILDTVEGVTSISVDGQWLYEATGSAIRRVPTAGGAAETVAPLRETGAAPATIGHIVASGGYVVARQDLFVPRGCQNSVLVEYGPGEESRLLSGRGGAFTFDGNGVVHAPRDCFLIAAQPPFTLERFCPGTWRIRSSRR